MHTTDELMGLEPRASRIGAYRLLGHWASGEVSHVYVARREGDPSGRLFAVKVARTAHAIYAAREGVFLRGAKQAPEAVHPHTVSTREVLDRNGRLYMVTDFVNAELLTRVIEARAGAPWPVPLALTVGLHVARALEFVHGSQTGTPSPHGEVGPRNVQLGYDGRARLLDSTLVGTARRRRESRHIAPEQAAQMPDIDVRVDVYGVGLLVWELLTGRPAHEGRDETTLRAAALEGRIPAPSRAGAASDPAVDALVLEALSVERELRPASAAALARRLEVELARLGAGQDVEAELRELMRGAFPLGASRLPRLLERWAEPPDRVGLMRPGGPLAAIQDALGAGHGAEADPFEEIDAALEALTRDLPPVDSGAGLPPESPPPEAPSPPEAPAAPPPRRGWLLAAAVVLLGGLGVFLLRAGSSGPPPPGRLRIVTQPPGAEVRVGGEARGQTPLRIDVPVGQPQRVEIRKEGFMPVARDIAFEAPGERGWDLELKPADVAPPDEAFKGNPY